MVLEIDGFETEKNASTRPGDSSKFESHLLTRPDSDCALGPRLFRFIVELTDFTHGTVLRDLARPHGRPRAIITLYFCAAHFYRAYALNI